MQQPFMSDGEATYIIFPEASRHDAVTWLVSLTRRHL